MALFKYLFSCLRRSKPAKAQFITFPRSGHHLLVRLLWHYYTQSVLQGRDWLIESPQFTYCSNYRHCNSNPCTNATTTHQKDHDFSLDVRVVPTFSYIVQIRNPLNSLPSWYKLAVDYLGFADDQATWESFAVDKLQFWKGFVRKWIVSDIHNRVIIKYESLLRKPQKSIIQALQATGQHPHLQSIKAAIATGNIAPMNHLQDFKYYKAEFFQNLASWAQPELGVLGYSCEGSMV